MQKLPSYTYNTDCVIPIRSSFFYLFLQRVALSRKIFSNDSYVTFWPRATDRWQPSKRDETLRKIWTFPRKRIWRWLSRWSRCHRQTEELHSFAILKFRTLIGCDFCWPEWNWGQSTTQFNPGQTLVNIIRVGYSTDSFMFRQPMQQITHWIIRHQHQIYFIFDYKLIETVEIRKGR